jgi:diguanylate cyclase (GGDEF)-like protein
MRRNEHGIQEYVIWLTLVPLLVMGVSFGTFFLLDRFADLNRDLRTRGRLIARQLAASSEYGVFSNNQSFLKNVTASALQQHDVEAVMVLSADSSILVASGELAGTGTKNHGEAIPVGSDSIKALLMRIADKPAGSANGDLAMLDQADGLILYQPILSTQIAIEENEEKPAARKVGAVIIKMSTAAMGKLKAKLLWLTILATATFLLATLYLVHIFSRRIIGPISRLSEAIQVIGAGNLETTISVQSDIRELSTLSNGIDRMRADLLHERTILQHRIDEATGQLRNLAFYDTLTQLPNRRLLTDRIAQALTACKRSGRYGALMFIDLDNFKSLNDQFGHAVGDLLLIEVASRIRRCVRETDTVARFGGDEFVVALKESGETWEESVIQTNIVAEKIRTALEEPYSLVYRQVGHPEICLTHHCAASIGVALFRGNDVQEDILRYADTAMYQAKQDGRNRIHFYKS